MSDQLGICDGAIDGGIANCDKPHPHWPNCVNWRPVSQPPTEMTSLTQIKDKLDAIKEQLRAMDAGLHEAAMRNHQQVLAQFRPPRKASKKARRRQER